MMVLNLLYHLYIAFDAGIKLSTTWTRQLFHFWSDFW